MNMDIVVYPKDRPVSPLTARVTESYPAFFFIIYDIGGWRWCLTELVHHLSGKGGKVSSLVGQLPHYGVKDRSLQGLGG